MTFFSSCFLFIYLELVSGQVNVHIRMFRAYSAEGQCKGLSPRTHPVMSEEPQLASTFIGKIDCNCDSEIACGLLLQLEWPTFNTVTVCSALLTTGWVGFAGTVQGLNESRRPPGAGVKQTAVGGQCGRGGKEAHALIAV